MGCSVVTAVVAVVLLVLLPWPHYWWACSRDSVPAYGFFARRFPSSDLATAARERIRVLREDDVWTEADGSSKIELLRNYRKVYPDGKYRESADDQVRALADAKWVAISASTSRSEVVGFLRGYPETTRKADAESRLVQIADTVWDQIEGTRSVPEIEEFIADYPGTTKREAAEARIQQLYNDWDWVREQDDLKHYQRFISRFPDHPRKAWIAKRIIDLEVREIAAGDHGEMPRAQPLSFGGSVATVEVENRTGYELTVRYSGPDSKKLVLAKGATQTTVILPGDYEVAASVTAAHVRNYYGRETVQGGMYSSRFYIATDYGVPQVPSYKPRR
jgi:hypothetical protein